MNPVKQIGRYQLPILNVIAIMPRSGVKAFLTSLLFWLVALAINLKDRSNMGVLKYWPHPGYDVILNNGVRLHFTVEERELYDQARITHEKCMRIYGMARTLGARI